MGVATRVFGAIGQQLRSSVEMEGRAVIADIAPVYWRHPEHESGETNNALFSDLNNSVWSSVN
jgi:hypothetical protein